jgi:hypothetical protein
VFNPRSNGNCVGECLAHLGIKNNLGMWPNIK